MGPRSLLADKNNSAGKNIWRLQDWIAQARLLFSVHKPPKIYHRKIMQTICMWSPWILHCHFQMNPLFCFTQKRSRCSHPVEYIICWAVDIFTWQPLIIMALFEYCIYPYLHMNGFSQMALIWNCASTLFAYCGIEWNYTCKQWKWLRRKL